jgi:hypothetical protein
VCTVNIYTFKPRYEGLSPLYSVLSAPRGTHSAKLRFTALLCFDDRVWTYTFSVPRSHDQETMISTLHYRIAAMECRHRVIRLLASMIGLHIAEVRLESRVAWRIHGAILNLFDRDSVGRSSTGRP